MTPDHVAAALAPSIRAMAATDWDAVRRIYAQGIATRNATFETDVPTAEALDAKWIPGHRWVILDDRAAANPAGDVLGWAAMTATSARDCYRGVAETSIYIDTTTTGRGLGKKLLAHQVEAALAAGFWTLQTSIFPENEASLAIHRAAGFRDIGRRHAIAQLDGIWRDTILLELRAPLAP